MSFSEYFAPVEAVLFASGHSVTVELISKALGKSLKETTAILDEMTKWYNSKERGIRMVRLEESYQLCTKKEYYEYLIRVEINAEKPRLSPVVLETLSIIAYRQPVTRVEIEKIRGVKSDHAVNKLIEYGLIEEKGRLELPGRPVLFGTTEEFLRKFGLNGAEDLPEISPDLIDKLNCEEDMIADENQGVFVDLDESDEEKQSPGDEERKEDLVNEELS